MQYTYCLIVTGGCSTQVVDICSFSACSGLMRNMILCCCVIIPKKEAISDAFDAAPLSLECIEPRMFKAITRGELPCHDAVVYLPMVPYYIPCKTPHGKFASSDSDWST